MENIRVWMQLALKSIHRMRFITSALWCLNVSRKRSSVEVSPAIASYNQGPGINSPAHRVLPEHGCQQRERHDINTSKCTTKSINKSNDYKNNMNIYPNAFTCSNTVIFIVVLSLLSNWSRATVGHVVRGIFCLILILFYLCTITAQFQLFNFYQPIFDHFIGWF